MSKLNSHKLSILATLLLIAGVLFFMRGWLREAVLPKIVKITYGNSVEKTYKEEMNKLQDPLSLLGYTTKELENSDCYRVVANGFQTQIDCTHDTRVFRIIGSSPDARKDLVAGAEKVQGLLKANGWQGRYSNDDPEYASLVKIVSSVTANIDYQPNTMYEKHVGHVVCYFTTNTAYSEPDPPAISTQISCARSVNIFGQPSWD